MNSRNKGNTYERAKCIELRSKGFTAISSRSESRNLDNLGVDIVTNAPFNIQCKAVEKLRNIHGTLTRMSPDKTRVLFAKKNYKPELAIMLLEDFYKVCFPFYLKPHKTLTK